MPEYMCQTPDPDDKEAWRQWTKLHLIAIVVVCVLAAVVFIFKAL